MQCPEAAKVAGYQTWKEEFDRQVKEGEEAIWIWAPIITNKCPDCGNSPSYHERGDVLTAYTVYIRGDVGPDDNTGRWNSVPGAGSVSEIQPGSTVTLGLGTGPVPGDYTVRVVHQLSGNESATTLAQSSGPAA
jgi:hypothetical protein